MQRRSEKTHLRKVAAVDDAEAGGGGKLGPVGRAAEPLQVLPQECVHRRAAVHDGVGENRSAVAHRVPSLRAARLSRVSRSVPKTTVLRVTRPFNMYQYPAMKWRV